MPHLYAVGADALNGAVIAEEIARVPFQLIR
jgi:hypothetical protein